MRLTGFVCIMQNLRRIKIREKMQPHVSMNQQRPGSIKQLKNLLL